MSSEPVVRLSQCQSLVGCNCNPWTRAVEQHSHSLMSASVVLAPDAVLPPQNLTGLGVGVEASETSWLWFDTPVSAPLPNPRHSLIALICFSWHMAVSFRSHDSSQGETARQWRCAPTGKFIHSSLSSPLLSVVVERGCNVFFFGSFFERESLSECSAWRWWKWFRRHAGTWSEAFDVPSPRTWIAT